MRKYVQSPILSSFLLKQSVDEFVEDFLWHYISCHRDEIKTISATVYRHTDPEEKVEFSHPSLTAEMMPDIEETLIRIFNLGTK